jgi:hypothetical protein
LPGVLQRGCPDIGADNEIGETVEFGRIAVENDEPAQITGAA